MTVAEQPFTAEELAIRLLADPDALIREDKRLKLRDFALSNTVNFAKVTGNNPWDFEKEEPVYDPNTGFYPWCDYDEQFARYLDKKPQGIAKPIKIGFIARDHKKTNDVEHTLARRGAINANKNIFIICDSDRKAQQRLNRIAGIFKSEAMQWLFPEKFHPDDARARFHYPSEKIYLRERYNDEPTFIAMGVNSSFAVRLTSMYMLTPRRPYTGSQFLDRLVGISLRLAWVVRWGLTLPERGADRKRLLLERTG